MTRGWWALMLTPLLLVLFCFPPMRQNGLWFVDTSQVTDPSIHNKLDRQWFGYIPTFQWIGSLGNHIDTGLHTTIMDGTTYSSDSAWWVVEWWMIIAEIILIALILLPFIRAGSQKGMTS